ncbi:MAG: hypothetical protein ACOY4U_04585 [Pseudomonadota bacterium]
MDGRLEARMKGMVEQLAREHQQELAAAGTLVDLEELTSRIGDEVTRMLTEQELVRRGREHAHRPADCPDCGQSCLPDYEPEPTVLIGLRGELAYQQPKYYCDRCRRCFFPSERAVGTTSPQYGDDEGAPESGVGRRE